MKAKRIKYSDNQNSILYSETRGCCPLCLCSILFQKKNPKKTIKGYEIAHIYPLNPTTHQKKILANEINPTDINDLTNVIALCPSCHSKYDKDFRLEDMKRLREIKDNFLNEAKALEKISEYSIQDEIFQILENLELLCEDLTETAVLNFDISTVEKKLKTGISPLQKEEIKSNAIKFYVRVRDHIKILEQNNQISIKILLSQIKIFYLEMENQNPGNKDLIFNYIARWISMRTGKSIVAARVLTAFFVQNCEVFDADSK